MLYRVVLPRTTAKHQLLFCEFFCIIPGMNASKIYCGKTLWSMGVVVFEAYAVALFRFRLFFVRLASRLPSRFLNDEPLGAPCWNKRE